jgi:hypothetical protein
MTTFTAPSARLTTFRAPAVAGHVAGPPAPLRQPDGQPAADALPEHCHAGAEHPSGAHRRGRRLPQRVHRQTSPRTPAPPSIPERKPSCHRKSKWASWFTSIVVSRGLALCDSCHDPHAFPRRKTRKPLTVWQLFWQKKARRVRNTFGGETVGSGRSTHGNALCFGRTLLPGIPT